MRVLVFGSGAIGGVMAAGLIDAGADVALLDRGPQYSALKAGGLRVIDREGRTRTFSSMRVVREPREFGPADLVVLAVKAYQIRPALAAIETALAGGATLLTLQNGLPWWYFQGLPGVHAGRVLEAVDGDGSLAGRIDPRRIVGCIAYPAAELVEPGVVRHVEGDRFPVGELDGSRSTRCDEIRALLESAGFKSPLLDDLRGEIWVKAWGTLAFNPISALTGMTMAEICRTPPTRALAVRMMTEAQEIATRLGVSLRVPLEKRLVGAERVGHHKTSMLQDLEARRPLEIDAILGSVVEIGELAGAPVDTLRAVLDLTRAIDPSLRHAPATEAAIDATREAVIAR
jgi:2-dehydropantoate 2-reductase